MHSSQDRSSSSYQRCLISQLHYFQQLLKNFPKSFQYQLIPYLNFAKTQIHQYQKARQKISQILKNIGNTRQLKSNNKQIQVFFKVYQSLYEKQSQSSMVFPKLLSKVVQRVKLLKNDKQSRDKYYKKYYQQQYPEKIDKLDSLSKQFEYSSKLSKIFSEHNLCHHQRKAKQPTIELIPRFLYRLQQILHYQSNAQYLGNILCLTYDGNKIIGNKSYAVINNNMIQLWQRKATHVPQVNLIIEEEEKQQDKDKPPNFMQEQKQQKQVQIIPKQSRSYQKMKLSQIFTSHVQKITSVAISYDQMYMLSTGVDKCIKLWCLRMKILIAQYYGHMQTVWDIKWAPNGYYFVSGGADKVAIVWRTDYPSPQRMFDHKGEIYKVDFLKNNDFIITAGQEGVVRVWRITNAQCIREIIFPSEILNFQISFSGAYLGLYELSGQISIYDISKGQKVTNFKLTEGQFTTAIDNQKATKTMRPHDIAFSEDQRQLVIVTTRHVFLYSMDALRQKVAMNIYDIENNDVRNKKKQQPKEVIYMGRDFNLTYCKYTRKHLLVVAGTRKNGN